MDFVSNKLSLFITEVLYPLFG